MLQYEKDLSDCCGWKFQLGIVVMDVVKRVEEGQAFTRYKFTKYCIEY